MQMIGVAVRDPDEGRLLHRVTFRRGQRPVKPPTAEVAGALQPRIGRQQRPALVVKDQGRIAERLKAEPHHRSSANRGTPLYSQPA